MKKFTTAYRLKQIMSERNLKQVDILRACKPYCEQYGVKLEKNDLSQYISGKVMPGQDKLTILGLALGVNEVWLMGYDVPSGKNELQYIKENKNNGAVEIENEEDIHLMVMFHRLDTYDRKEVINFMEFKLSDDKYKKDDTEYRTA